ncbi:hypothetical protein [Arenimonas alkanexedens]
MNPFTRLLAMLLLLVACWSAQVMADSWPLAEIAVYRSANAGFRFTVVPGDLGAGAPGPSGTLARRGSDGQWETVWLAPLVNWYAPVEVLVADQGDFVVTFDNWASLGIGDDVVVIYDARGKVAASLGLDDILPTSIIEALPRSSSSIWWGGEHRFDASGKEVLLAVAVPGSPRLSRADRYFRVRVRLATGEVQVVRDMDWTHALAASARVRAKQRQEREVFERPLQSPAVDSRRSWRRYSWEVFLRMDPDWDAGRFESLLVRLPPDQDYLGDVRSIRGLLGYSRPGGRRWPESPPPRWRAPVTAMVFASPAPAALADVLVNEAATLGAGSLSGWRVYVVCEPRDAGRLRMALARLGADVIAVDPDTPIPQRAERLALRRG